ncbi:MAG: hypothetical protein HY552_04160 [Elusimicrobia bacterium]|nr:hypothetical protein [Elusimicrobiota bacterium]
MSRATSIIIAFLELVAVACPAFCQENVEGDEAATTKEESERLLDDEPAPKSVPAQQPPIGIEPRAEPDKLAIREALIQKDLPRAREMLTTALGKYPNDPELRRAHDRMMLNLHNEKARTVMDRTLSNGINVFGRQWLPGPTLESPEWSIILKETGAGDAKTVLPPRAAAVTKALARGYALIDRGDSARADKVLSDALRRHDKTAELYYARVMARGLAGKWDKADEDSRRALALSDA